MLLVGFPATLPVHLVATPIQFRVEKKIQVCLFYVTDTIQSYSKETRQLILQNGEKLLQWIALGETRPVSSAHVSSIKKCLPQVGWGFLPPFHLVMVGA